MSHPWTRETRKSVSNREAVGSDGLPPGLLKVDHPAFTQRLHNIVLIVWVTGEDPQQYKYAIIKTLQMKNSRTDCNN